MYIEKVGREYWQKEVERLDKLLSQTRENSKLYKDLEYLYINALSELNYYIENDLY